MKTAIVVIAVIMLVACGRKVEQPTAPTPDVSTPINRDVFIQEHTTPSGVTCVVATMYSYGPAISCDWK
jgi:uncharacterized lipoprotein YbaY